MSEFDFNDASAMMENPLMYMAMAGGGGTPRQQPNMGQYVQNYERRKAIRQSLYPPGPQGGMRAPRGSQGSQAQMPNVAGNYGISQNGVDAANTALQPFGLSEPTHINPFLMFNDQHADGSPTWAGNHPGIARALEGALVGATTPGGATTGENISNIARTALGIPGMYRANANAQMEAPFGEANQIMALQHGKAQLDQMASSTNYNNAHAEYEKHLPDLREQQNAERAKPYISPQGNAFAWNGKEWARAPQFDEDPRKTGSPHELMAKDIVDQKNAERKEQGLPPLNSDETMAVVKEFSKTKGRPLVPRIDPELQFHVNETDKDIKQAQDDYARSGMPNDPIQAQILQHTDPARYQRALDAQERLQKAREKKAHLLEQHYHYSSNAAANDTSNDSDTSDDSDMPAPIASVRVPPPGAPGPVPGTVVSPNKDAKGRSMLVPAPNPQNAVPSQNPFRH